MSQNISMNQCKLCTAISLPSQIASLYLMSNREEI